MSSRPAVRREPSPSRQRACRVVGEVLYHRYAGSLCAHDACCHLTPPITRRPPPRGNVTGSVSAVGCIGLFGRDVLRDNAERATLIEHATSIAARETKSRPPRSCGICRTLRIKAHPSSSGIPMSVRSTSKRPRSICSKASAAEAAVLTSAPQEVSTASSNSRASGSSSTTSTRRPSRSGGQTMGRRQPPLRPGEPAADRPQAQCARAAAAG